MARFYGALGFVRSEEVTPGVWNDIVTKKYYDGTVIQDTRRWNETEGLNSDLVIDNSISVVADPYAYQNLFAIRFVEWLGTAWKVKSVEVKRPRLILYIGGVYNEHETG